MSDLRNYSVVTGAYWAFTVTDGALRMLVLLGAWSDLLPILSSSPWLSHCL